MEHLFGARIRDPNGIRLFGARIAALFGAQIREPNGTAFARIEQLFGARGSWLWMFLQGLFGGHRFNLHICVHQPFFRGPNGIRLFGARIRDPNGTAFSGPESGPESNNFSRPGALVHVSLGVLWRPPFLCPPAIFSGPESYTTFRGPNPGPEWNSVSGPESGPYNRTTFRGPGLLAAHVSLGALWRPPFQSAHLCSPAFFSRPEWYTTFRGPNPGPEWNSFFGARVGAQIEQLFGARGSCLWMFLQGLFEATVSICTFVSTSHLFGARME